MSDQTYTSALTNSTIPSIYETYNNRLSAEFLPNKSLSTLWFNSKNHFRTEQIVALATHHPLNIQWLLEPADPKGPALIKTEHTSILDYHKAITDAVFEHLKAQTAFSDTRARSNYSTEQLVHSVYETTSAVSRRLFGSTNEQASRRTSTSSSPEKSLGFIDSPVLPVSAATYGKNKQQIDYSPKVIAPHIVEYFSYLPIVAAAHVMADTATSSPFWWYSHQLASLIVITDAITEYNIKERTMAYGSVFQPLYADLLYALRDIEDPFLFVTCFSLTTVQSLPSVIDANFWNHDSDLEHEIDQIAGCEQNAAMCLFRRFLLKCADPFTLTVLDTQQTVESSRRLYRYLRESKTIIGAIPERASVVCSCETSIISRPKPDERTINTLYSITPEGLPCWRRKEVMAVCAVWFISVLATFFGLVFNPDISEQYHLDPSGTASLVIFYMGMVVSGYKMLRTDQWSWYDFVRGRYYSKFFKDCPFKVDNPTIIRTINDDCRHFSALVRRARNSFLLDYRSGSFEFDVNISMEDMYAAGIMTYTDGSIMYAFDPLNRSRKLVLYKLFEIEPGTFHIDDEFVEKVKPIKQVFLTGRVL
ncbi:hypothetical protein BGX21_003361 [Mortierella sp. AD011]|nr:hypothetical protein BGX20_004690 [Mortierella sp. AD010]KAF9376896.1 hypothetical protein BGX21_003361 [Mortierella sp. AD011]